MVTIEPFAFTVRLGNNHEKFGDPYTATCTCIKTGPTQARIVALAGEVNLEMLAKLRRLLRELYGINDLYFERFKGENKADDN